MISERLKYLNNNRIVSNNYFWRTYNQQGIDWVEERGGKLYGYEFKWNPKKTKIQQVWLDTYENASFEVVHRDNFMEYV